MRGRLFTGDTIYPFTCMHLDCLGSNVEDFQATLGKLTDFTAAHVPHRWLPAQCMICGCAVQPGIKMAAGHVQENLDPEGLAQVATLVGTVQAGMLQPSSVDDGYGEYTDGMFSIMMKIPSQ